MFFEQKRKKGKEGGEKKREVFLVHEERQKRGRGKKTDPVSTMSRKVGEWEGERQGGGEGDEKFNLFFCGRGGRGGEERFIHLKLFTSTGEKRQRFRKTG